MNMKASLSFFWYSETVPVQMATALLYPILWDHFVEIYENSMKFAKTPASLLFQKVSQKCFDLSGYTKQSGNLALAVFHPD